jgi:hypothetical protein
LEVLKGNPAVSYQSELRLVTPDGTRALATNRDIGKIVSLGHLPPGEEYQFELHVTETDKTFRSGPASRNPDRMAHAVVKKLPNGDTIVGFEDVSKNGDGGFAKPDYTYDDMQFRIRPVRDSH